VGQRVEVPVVEEGEDAEHGGHVRMAGASVQRDGHVAAARVHQALGHDGAKLWEKNFKFHLYFFCIFFIFYF
jgi:hypothetical protein